MEREYGEAWGVESLSQKVSDRPLTLPLPAKRGEGAPTLRSDIAIFEASIGAVNYWVRHFLARAATLNDNRLHGTKRH
jgi:hypothetical protein